MEFELKGEKLKHKFYVVDNMNRNLILGRDWMIDNKIRIYYDLGCLRIGNTCICSFTGGHAYFLSTTLNSRY